MQVLPLSIWDVCLHSSKKKSICFNRAFWSSIGLWHTCSGGKIQEEEEQKGKEGQERNKREKGEALGERQKKGWERARAWDWEEKKGNSAEGQEGRFWRWHILFLQLLHKAWFKIQGFLWSHHLLSAQKPVCVDCTCIRAWIKFDDDQPNYDIILKSCKQSYKLMYIQDLQFYFSNNIKPESDYPRAWQISMWFDRPCFVGHH